MPSRRSNPKTTKWLTDSSHRARAPDRGSRGGRSPLRFHIARPCPAAITHGGSFPARSASRRRVTLSWRPPYPNLNGSHCHKLKRARRGPVQPRVERAGYAENDVPHPQVDFAFGFTNVKPPVNP